MNGFARDVPSCMDPMPSAEDTGNGLEHTAIEVVTACICVGEIARRAAGENRQAVGGEDIEFERLDHELACSKLLGPRQASPSKTSGSIRASHVVVGLSRHAVQTKGRGRRQKSVETLDPPARLGSLMRRGCANDQITMATRM